MVKHLRLYIIICVAALAAACGREAVTPEEILAGYVGRDVHAVAVVDLPMLAQAEKDAGADMVQALPIASDGIDMDGRAVLAWGADGVLAFVPAKGDDYAKELESKGFRATTVDGRLAIVAVKGAEINIEAIAENAKKHPLPKKVVERLCAPNLLNFYAPALSDEIPLVGNTAVAGHASIKGDELAINAVVLDAKGNERQVFDGPKYDGQLSRYGLKDATLNVGVGDFRGIIRDLAPRSVGWGVKFLPEAPALLSARVDMAKLPEIIAGDMDGVDFTIAALADGRTVEGIVSALRMAGMNPEKHDGKYVYRVFAGTRPRAGREYYDDDYYEDVYRTFTLQSAEGVAVISTMTEAGTQDVKLPQGSIVAQVNVPQSPAVTALTGVNAPLSGSLHADGATLDITVNTGENAVSVLNMWLKEAIK